MITYKEPRVSVLVLDFIREAETRLCLQSVRQHFKIDYQIIYLHNGPSDYPAQLLKEGLIDRLIQPAQNLGLGCGTRDLFAASFSPWSLYLQNDQIIRRDFTDEELNQMISYLGIDYQPSDYHYTIKSISLAGSPCGLNIYSERMHLIETATYKDWERQGILGCHGAGPYHDGPWREEQIQTLYRKNDWAHYEWPWPLVIDNGGSAMRQNPDGSIWEHFTDTKSLFLIKGPVKEKYVYPKFSEKEWLEVIENQSWPQGKIPENEVKDSFHVWH